MFPNPEITNKFWQKWCLFANIKIYLKMYLMNTKGRKYFWVHQRTGVSGVSVVWDRKQWHKSRYQVKRPRLMPCLCHLLKPKTKTTRSISKVDSLLKNTKGPVYPFPTRSTWLLLYKWGVVMLWGYVMLCN